MGPPASHAVSRLAADDVLGDLGVMESDTVEIACLRGLPVTVPIGEDITVVREWPNLAGRCEPFSGDHIVRWDRTLAPEPQSDHVVGRNTSPSIPLETSAEAVAWFRRTIRSLEQHPGVLRATPSETARCILLTPWAIDDTTTPLPEGVRKVPSRLAEFPGGLVVSFDADRWDLREEYASDIQDWFAERIRQAKEGQP